MAGRFKPNSDDAYAASRQLFFAFADKGQALLELTAKRASLEDIFLELTDSTSAQPAEQPSAEHEQEEEPI